MISAVTGQVARARKGPHECHNRLARLISRAQLLAEGRFSADETSNGACDDRFRANAGRDEAPADAAAVRRRPIELVRAATAFRPPPLSTNGTTAGGARVDGEVWRRRR